MTGSKLNTDGSDTGDLVDGTRRLKVAQWEHAYRPTGRQVKEKFVDFDPDRFYIRVPAVGSSEEDGPKVFVTTYDSNGEILDDKTEVEMQIDPELPGMLISKSMILVSDDIDDDFRGIGDVGLDALDDAKGDRSHKIELKGKICVDINLGDSIGKAYFSVPSEQNSLMRTKTVFAHAVILKNKAGSEGVAPVSAQDVIEDFSRIRQRYAQLNVDVQLAGEPIIVDPPAGVNLEDGLHGQVDDAPIMDQLGTPSSDDLYIFYVNEVKVIKLDPNLDPYVASVAGIAFTESGVGVNWQSRANNAFVSLTGPISVGNEAIITAHEIGHILTNGGHYAGANQLLNIMLDGASVKDEDNVGVETTARPKRFFDEQETLIRGHHLAN